MRCGSRSVFLQRMPPLKRSTEAGVLCRVAAKLMVELWMVVRAHPALEYSLRAGGAIRAGLNGHPAGPFSV